ncbi:MAG: hypothetical protein HQK66_04625 [Desulfamplus sp.]|nr:hypothetical protein [Desulfamplus sp.]
MRKNLLPLMGIILTAVTFWAGCMSPGDKGTKLREMDRDHIYSVAELFYYGEKIHGKIINVHGKFMGWKGCPGKTGNGKTQNGKMENIPPTEVLLRTEMISRSDWTLADETSCIFVTGGFPGRLNPKREGDIGTTVTFKALVIFRDGVLNLRLMQRSEKP